MKAKKMKPEYGWVTVDKRGERTSSMFRSLRHAKDCCCFGERVARVELREVVKKARTKKARTP